MNDWMRLDEAWWYTHHRSKPIKGAVVHTAYGTNAIAWFVPDGGTVNDGFTVLDEEGTAGDEGVWFTKEVPMSKARAAMRKYWNDELDRAKITVRGIKGVLEDLGVELTEEVGAE